MKTKMSSEEGSQPTQFNVSFTPHPASGTYNIYLFGEIEDTTQFIPAIEVLSQATQMDVVVIHLSTNGGCLGATDTFIQAMRECEAKIVVKATGGVYSAGTLILLAADEFSLSENFTAMCHNGSVGSSGKYSDWRGEVKHTEKFMDRVMRSSYAGFFSEEEIEGLLDGKDIWLDRDGWIARWEAMQDAIEEAEELLYEDGPAGDLTDIDDL